MTEAVQEVVPPVVEQVVPKNSLLEGMKKATTVPVNSGSDSTTVSHAHSQDSWLWSEGVPGTGSKPEWLNSKYKSVAEQAKSQLELEKMLGSTTGAPDEYDLGELKEAIDLTNPHIMDLMSKAKSKRVNNETFKEFAEAFVNYTKKDAVDFSKEIEKLGPDGGRIVDTVRVWAENNLSQDSLDTIGKIGMSAEAIKLLDELRQFQYHSSSQPPSGSDLPSGFVVLTVAEIEAEMQSNWKRYNDDPVYRKQITKKFEQAVG